ncbi:MAG: glycosyltransferase family 2 protein [Bacteroidia bacterium]|nr:glycosyltransferase family 2 protein [Bacteroidia bacterium]
MQGISAVIITKNEEKNIGRCLSSLKDIADEVIIIDSFSEDQTAEICRNFGVKFLTREWKGYAEAKNYGNSLARFSHILWIDADESLSGELRTILLLEKEHLEGGYAFNRLNNYCGRWIRHGNWYPDVRLRVFPKEKAVWKGDYVHEYLESAPGLAVKTLRGDLEHHSYYTVQEHWERADKYARLGAQQLAASDKKMLWLYAILSPLARWLRGYLLRGGFLDFRAGWNISRIESWEKWRKYRLAVRLRRGDTLT